MNKTKNMKKYFKFKKHILILLVLWIIYLIGIPLHYTPYALQPSYWEFKKMCELNELPNSEEKYNKILSYFDKKLGDRDDFPHTKQYSRRIRLSLDIYPNGISRLDFDKIQDVYINVKWQTYHIETLGNEGNMDFRFDFDNELYCGYIYNIHNLPNNFFKDRRNDKQTANQ
ncbi:hypothetical protein [Helicobacter hepaticus]|jgi:hypothetical protein|nr:hypothetical protein [Helicobacter hepaticus]